MSGLGQTVAHLWPWVASAAAALGAVWRWWPSRSRPSPPQSYDAEDILFPRPDSARSSGRTLARWLSAPVRLSLKEAGEQATAEEMAGLRDDLKRVLADNKRLRAELAALAASGAGSTATATASPPPSRRRRPSSAKSDD